MDVSHRLAAKLGKSLRERKLILATAESCTGGWVAKVVTAVAGSSEWYDRGYVTYSDAAKSEMLDVSGETIAEHGAVSEPVVRAMAEGAIAKSGAHIAVAISGIAGPLGGTPIKPVGTVCLSWAMEGQETRSSSTHFAGDRNMVRQQAVMAAIQGLVELVAESSPVTEEKPGRAR